MYSITWNATLHDAHRLFITEGGARDAFDRIIEHAKTFSGFDIEPAMQGRIRCFRYRFGNSETMPYSFTINKKSLLFYVRLSGLKNLPFGETHLVANLSKVTYNPAGELRIRLNSAEDADKLLNYLFGNSLTK